ncbi:MAG: TlpA family protein disulfide reductase [Eubacterium sp.]|nr:TlpA family protein disulfide reductase [Eubacterium sp.]
MKKQYLNKIMTCICCLVLLLALAACKSGSGTGASNDKTSADTDTAGEENQGQDFIFWNRSGEEGTLAFATEDMEGNEVTSEDYQDAKLILVNYWEPWCGPCVSEMPDLEKLYEKYKDQGFLVLGVFSSRDMDEDARSILADSGTSYPILRANRQFMTFMTGYYPTSFFTDGSGRVLSKEPIIGAQAYDDWEKLILEYLEQ